MAFRRRMPYSRNGKYGILPEVSLQRTGGFGNSGYRCKRQGYEECTGQKNRCTGCGMDYAPATTIAHTSVEAVRPEKETLCCGKLLLCVYILQYRTKNPIFTRSFKGSVHIGIRSESMLQLLIPCWSLSTTY